MSNPENIYSGLSPVPEVAASNIAELEPHLAKKQPFIVRGLVKDWPLVQAGKISGKSARDYLQDKAQDRAFAVSMGSEDFGGRIFYREDMSPNVQMGKAKLPLVFERIDSVENDENLPIVYLSAINMKQFFNGLHEENNFNVGPRKPSESIWIGTKSRIAAHNDSPENLAFVAVGRRRFTLFPPAEFKNLYIGPIDNTPAGRAISMVDFHNPDWDKYPKFSQALTAGLTIELEPGDAIHIPSLWWHHVEGLDPFNVLINYWWQDTPRYLGGAQNALTHAIMAIRDLPLDQKQHWQEQFQHYVFDNSEDVLGHIPKNGHGILGPMTPQSAGKIRSFLIKMLSSE